MSKNFHILIEFLYFELLFIERLKRVWPWQKKIMPTIQFWQRKRSGWWQWWFLWFFWWLWYSHIGAHDGGGGYGCSTPMVMLRIVMVFWYCDERSRDGGGDNGFVTPMVVLNCSGGWRWFWYPSGCSGWWWWLWLWYNHDGGYCCGAPMVVVVVVQPRWWCSGWWWWEASTWCNERRQQWKFMSCRSRIELQCF